MDVAANQPEAIEWSTFDKCMERLDRSFIPFTSFVSPTRLARLAKSLLQCASYIAIHFLHLHQFRAAEDLPNLFSRIFGFPRLDYKITALIRIMDSKKGSSTHTSTAITSIFSRYFSPHDDAAGVRTILDMDDRARNALRNTVLVSTRWHYYCGIIGELFSNYSVEISPQSLGRVTQAIRLLSSIGYVQELFLIHRFSEGTHSPRESTKSRSLTLFLLAKLAGFNRYCKHLMSDLQLEIPGVLIPVSLVHNVRELGGYRNSIPYFANFPYIRRFRVDGKVFITSFVVHIR